MKFFVHPLMLSVLSYQKCLKLLNENNKMMKIIIVMRGYVTQKLQNIAVYWRHSANSATISLRVATIYATYHHPTSTL